MKTSPVLRRITLGLIGLLPLPPLPAADEAAPAPAAPGGAGKPYVLFMGADLAVQRDKKFHRVEDVVGSELKIKVGKKEFFVPTRNRMTGLKVNHSLKLAGASVQLDSLQAGPAYTPANDPVRKMIAASGAAGGAAAVQDLAWGRVVSEGLNASLVSQAAGTRPEGELAVNAANARVTDAVNAAEQLSDDMQFSSQYDTTQYVGKMYSELAEANYDAMEVSFRISSPVELDDPHMVILFKFQERDAKPGSEGLLIHAEALDPIGPKPKYIRVRQAGLPKGFKYLDSEVHIFNRGEEVATNASARRVELTREEAQQYLVIEHLGANKDATVPALAVAGTLPPERLKTLTLDQLNRTYYAKIGPDGSVLGLFADESCHLKSDDDAVLAAVSTAFFKPALVKGKPVEGVARVRLGEI